LKEAAKGSRELFLDRIKERWNELYDKLPEEYRIKIDTKRILELSLI